MCRLSRPLATIAACSPLLSGCGPSHEEAATAVLLALPAMVASVLLLIAPLRWLASQVRAVPPIAWRTVLVCGTSSLLVAVPAMIAVGDALEWVGMAYFVAGASYALWALVAWRVAHALRRPCAVADASLIAALITGLPAVFVLVSSSEPMGELALALWIYPGFAGYVSGPVYLALLLEGVVHVWLARR